MNTLSPTVRYAFRYGVLLAVITAFLFSWSGQALASPLGPGNHGSAASSGARAQAPTPAPTLAAGSPVSTPSPTAAPAQPARPLVPPLSPLRPLVATTYKWIDINLTKQLLIAYQGSKAVFSTYISSGVAKHKTPVGTFFIYAKLTSQEMIGGVGIEHYDLPNVPWVMYFYGGDAIHGTYWHHNFGHPMSHGCVNATIAAAAWLYTWAPMGTTVKVHY